MPSGFQSFQARLQPQPKIVASQKIARSQGFRSIENPTTKLSGCSKNVPVKINPRALADVTRIPCWIAAADQQRQANAIATKPALRVAHLALLNGNCDDDPLGCPSEETKSPGVSHFEHTRGTCGSSRLGCTHGVGQPRERASRARENICLGRHWTQTAFSAPRSERPNRLSSASASEPALRTVRSPRSLAPCR
jgi:hypothetical protein